MQLLDRVERALSQRRFKNDKPLEWGDIYRIIDYYNNSNESNFPGFVRIVRLYFASEKIHEIDKLNDHELVRFYEATCRIILLVKEKLLENQKNRYDSDLGQESDKDTPSKTDDVINRYKKLILRYEEIEKKSQTKTNNSVDKSINVMGKPAKSQQLPLVYRKLQVELVEQYKKLLKHRGTIDNNNSREPAKQEPLKKDNTIVRNGKILLAYQEIASRLRDKYQDSAKLEEIAGKRAKLLGLPKVYQKVYEQLLAQHDRELKIGENYYAEYNLLINYVLDRALAIDWFLHYLIKRELQREKIDEKTIAPQAFIKSIAIRVNSDYQFDNSPFPSEQFVDYKKRKTEPKHSPKPFIGREEIQEKFLRFLKGSDGAKKGVYLVTGYRGMGKTSFVNKVINEYRADENELNPDLSVIPITISLAQKQPLESDILRLMISHVYDNRIYIKGFTEGKRKRDLFTNMAKFSFFFGVAMLVLVMFLVFLENDKKYIPKPNWSLVNLSQTWLYNLLISSLIFIGVAVLVLILIKTVFQIPEINRYEKLKQLYKRRYNTLSMERSNQHELNITQFGTKLSGGGSQKEVTNYPMASLKEIEYGLIEFLNKIKDKAEFIFVFDELDKIESAAISTNYLDEVDSTNDGGAYLQQIRDRKQAIINIITGLKNFLTTANARFIFIAGREMFDATLADVADRQSSIGSIFNYVFYVESFLKESLKGGHNSRVSMGSLIEKYLIVMLLGDKYLKPQHANISFYKLIYENFFQKKQNRLNQLDETKIDHYLQSTGNLSEKESFKKALDDQKQDLQYQFMKTVVMLQNFLNYLIYRSNGSPKKIIKTLHEFVKITNNCEAREAGFVVENLSGNLDAKNPYLFFGYKDQYRVGFINHLYRPFIVKYGESFKKYSDNIIISTTYLFDHLLKFHPFAFSFSSLELIPEVLSTNKTPSLREHIITIIDYLSNNHLRETEIGIFDYKYYSRTVNELIYISKTFEEESAAFNFTLDESYLVKFHVRKQLKELRKVYTSAQPAPMVFSITHLCGILGDLHFFDQEYDEAIVAYSNAINSINNEVATISLTDFVVLIRFKLKLGLTFEKVKNYDEALSFYADAAENAKKFIMNRLDNGIHIDLAGQSKKDDSIYFTSMLSDLLQMVNQSFIAKIVLQEKMGIEGITALKFGLAVGSFLKLSEKVATVTGRNYLIHSNLYLVLGNLLYFKNSFNGFEKELGVTEWELFIINYAVDEWKNLYCLREKYNEFSSDNKRKPVVALSFYAMGMTEVIRSRFKEEDSLNFLFEPKSNSDLEKVSKAIVRTYEQTQYVNCLYKDESNSSTSSLPNDNASLCAGGIPYEFNKDANNSITRNLAKDILAYLKWKKILESDLFSKAHNKYIAMFLSHIGDCILGMIDVPGEEDNGYKNYQLEEIFDINEVWALKNRKDAHPFDIILVKNIEEPQAKFTITDVLQCYYWSAQFFKKRGRMISYSFQLRKILFTLRLVLKDVHNSKQSFNLLNEKAKVRVDILKKLEELILIPILNTASETSEHSDRHIMRKFEELRADLGDTKFDESLYSSYMVNNIANHPDTREAISLFMYIELKQTMFHDIKFEKYKKFVNPYDSYATQYTRLSELGFWGKLHRIQFQDRLKTFVDHGISNEILYSDKPLLNFSKEYLFTLFAQIHILEIYGLDYMVGHIFKAYVHFSIGDFVERYPPEIVDEAIKQIKGHFGYSIVGALGDKYYHFSEARTHYEKVKQLHSAGPEYIKNMDNIVYLEDDINDNALHFGAALDRFLLTNGTLDLLIGKAEANIEDKPVYNLEAYLKSKDWSVEKEQNN